VNPSSALENETPSSAPRAPLPRERGAAGLAIERVITPEGFSKLKEEWNDLLDSSSSGCLFLTWEWLHTWWSHLAAGRRLTLLLVRSGGDLVGLLPVAARPRRFSLSPPTLEFLGVGEVGSDYLDVLARRGSEREVAAALAAHLQKGEHVLRLARVREGSVADLLASELVRKGWSLRARSAGVCPFVPLHSSSFEDYLSSLGSAHRSNFRRRLRALSRLGSVGFEPVRSEAEREAALEVLIALHNGRWRERGGSDALHTPALVDFHREMSRLALERGWLRLFLLTVEKRPLAALYAFRYRDTFSFYQSGFDTSCKGLSVGLVSMGLAIRQAIEERAGEYDLLHGNEAYKSLWAREARGLRSLELFPDRATALLYGGTRDVAFRGRNFVRKMLPPLWAARLAAFRRRIGMS
jgi:CelD/BcsL family acetyltransferase involved in cellulose biosynthesis